MSLEREVGVLYVCAVNLLVLIEQVRVLEFLNRFVDDLSDPVVDTQASILHYHLLQVVELVTFIIVSLQVFYQLSNVLFRVHDLIRLLEFDSLDHHLGSAALFND